MSGSARAASFAALGLALAAASAVADEDLYFSSLPVVATVSRLPQAQADAPGSVTVIDRDMIRASGARSVFDLLRLVPGFQVAPPTTDAPRVAYHGLGNEDFSPRVQVLVDGRSQYSPLFLGGVNWTLMPVALEDIERIEVMRGSNSAAYGSNAFLGVINIITLDASQAKGTLVSASHGNQGVRDYTIRTGARLAPEADVRLTYQQRDDDGITNRNDWVDALGTRLLDLRADIGLSDRDELRLGLAHADSHIINGRVGKSCDPLREFRQRSDQAYLAWHRVPAPDEEIRLRYTHSEDWGSDRHVETCFPDDDLPIAFNLNIDYGGRSVRDDLEWQHTFSPWRDTRLVWGLGLRHDAVRAPIWFYGNKTVARQVNRLFGNLEWRPSASWLLNAGTTWENDDIGGTTFSPRLSASYHLTPEHTLRATVSRAHRTPSAVEARGDARAAPFAWNLPVPLAVGSFFDRQILADPAVKPERIDAFELGYLGELKDYRMSFDVRAFHERIPNRMVVLPRNLSAPNCDQLGQLDQVALLLGLDPPRLGCGTADYAVNGVRVKIDGVEYQWRWQPFDGTRLLLNQAFIRIDAGLKNIVTAADAEGLRRVMVSTEASAPRRASTLMLMQQLPWGVEMSATYHLVGEMQWTRNTQEPVPPYRRLDFRVAYSFRLGDTRGELAYVAQSANGEHAEFKFDRIHSERHWLTLRLDL